jgi:diadenosine tetraphosphate (Ap4A) HIT family hydrolase
VKAERLEHTMSEYRWPENYAELRRGEGCPMCGAGADETPHGVRVFEGRWADGYLGRYRVRPGYAYVVWKGRHVAEPTELSAEEAAGFWSEVAIVAGALDQCYRPVKMNWFSLGNGVPHLHVHLVPRPLDDARAGGPVEAEAFDVAATPAMAPAQLEVEAAALRAHLRR